MLSNNFVCRRLVHKEKQRPVPRNIQRRLSRPLLDFRKECAGPFRGDEGSELLPEALLLHLERSGRSLAPFLLLQDLCIHQDDGRVELFLCALNVAFELCLRTPDLGEL